MLKHVFTIVYKPISGHTYQMIKQNIATLILYPFVDTSNQRFFYNHRLLTIVTIFCFISSFIIALLVVELFEQSQANNRQRTYRTLEDPVVVYLTAVSRDSSIDTQKRTWRNNKKILKMYLCQHICKECKSNYLQINITPITSYRDTQYHQE